MNPDDLSRLIHQQLAAHPVPKPPHGVELPRCLVRPTQITVIERLVRDGKIEDSAEQVWLVLEEEPTMRHGYKIVFSERRGIFGLASNGLPADRYPVLCGWYGDFPDTLICM